MTEQTLENKATRGRRASTGRARDPRPSLRTLILSDLRAKARWCYEGDSPRQVFKTLLTDGTAAMVYYRLMQWARRNRVFPLELLCNKLNTTFCQCIIGRGAEFGPEFVIVHSNGVVINGSVRGGAGVVIEHQVTIGAERRRSPVLGNGVFLGAGAKVVGDVVIGDRARVGANAVVVDDIPADSTAVGIPARVVRVRGQSVPVESEIGQGGSPRFSLRVWG